MAWRKWGISLAIIGGIITTGFLAWYEIILPTQAAASHQQSVDEALVGLQAAYHSLEESTTLSLLDDPTASADQIESDLHSITQLITITRSRLHDLETSSEPAQLRYSGATPSYLRSQTVALRTTQIVEQSHETLRDYTDLVAFLYAYQYTLRPTRTHLDTFNAASDLNIYAGRGTDVRLVAAEIRADMQRLTSLSTPHELMGLKADTLLALEAAATGFDAFAYGLDIAIDDQIYAAAGELERADIQLSAVQGNTYTTTVAQTRTIKDVQTLREKLDPLTTR